MFRNFNILTDPVIGSGVLLIAFVLIVPGSDPGASDYEPSPAVRREAAKIEEAWRRFQGSEEARRAAERAEQESRPAVAAGHDSAGSDRAH